MANITSANGYARPPVIVLCIFNIGRLCANCVASLHHFAGRRPSVKMSAYMLPLQSGLRCSANNPLSVPRHMHSNIKAKGKPVAIAPA